MLFRLEQWLFKVVQVLNGDNYIYIDNVEGKISGSPWGCPAGTKAISWLKK